LCKGKIYKITKEDLTLLEVRYSTYTMKTHIQRLRTPAPHYDLKRLLKG